MIAHLRNHKEYSCDICNKTFKYQDILEKHIIITHEEAKLYCHFYNNETTCPFEQDCVFLHEHSSQCRYGACCERKLCMYKHKVNSSDFGDVGEDEVIDENEMNEDNEIPENERTFFNPYRETADDPEVELYYSFNCEMCIFKTTNKRRFIRHQKEVHSVQGKYVCTKCERTFKNKKEFNEHKYHGCGEIID